MASLVKEHPTRRAPRRVKGVRSPEKTAEQARAAVEKVYRKHPEPTQALVDLFRFHRTVYKSKGV